MENVDAEIENNFAALKEDLLSDLNDSVSGMLRQATLSHVQPMGIKGASACARASNWQKTFKLPKISNIETGSGNVNPQQEISHDELRHSTGAKLLTALPPIDSLIQAHHAQRSSRAETRQAKNATERGYLPSVRTIEESVPVDSIKPLTQNVESPDIALPIIAPQSSLTNYQPSHTFRLTNILKSRQKYTTAKSPGKSLPPLTVIESGREIHSVSSHNLLPESFSLSDHKGVVETGYDKSSPSVQRVKGQMVLPPLGSKEKRVTWNRALQLQRNSVHYSDSKSFELGSSSPEVKVTTSTSAHMNRDSIAGGHSMKSVADIPESHKYKGSTLIHRFEHSRHQSIARPESGHKGLLDRRLSLASNALVSFYDGVVGDITDQVEDDVALSRHKLRQVSSVRRTSSGVLLLTDVIVKNYESAGVSVPDQKLKSTTALKSPNRWSAAFNLWSTRRKAHKKSVVTNSRVSKVTPHAPSKRSTPSKPSLSPQPAKSVLNAADRDEGSSSAAFQPLSPLPLTSPPSPQPSPLLLPPSLPSLLSTPSSLALNPTVDVELKQVCSRHILPLTHTLIMPSLL